MRALILCLSVLGGLCCIGAAHSATDPAKPPAAVDTSCSGPVHAEAIALWEDTLRVYFARQIRTGLVQKGNTYAMYYAQEELQPFVEMSRRCSDRRQIGELVETLAPAFDALEPLPGSSGKGWVCHSGPVCNDVNHLLGKEVQLNSAQFLAVLGAVATAVVEIVPQDQRTSAERQFIASTAGTIAEQLDHWLDPIYFLNVENRSQMRASSPMGTSSRYFFLDRDLGISTNCPT